MRSLRKIRVNLYRRTPLPRHPTCLDLMFEFSRIPTNPCDNPNPSPNPMPSHGISWVRTEGSRGNCTRLPMGSHNTPQHLISRDIPRHLMVVPCHIAVSHGVPRDPTWDIVGNHGIPLESRGIPQHLICDPAAPRGIPWDLRRQ